MRTYYNSSKHGSGRCNHKNSAPYTDCIILINNTQVDNAKDIDIVMPMYSLIE